MSKWTLRKRIEIAGAHSLRLNYDSPCKNVHGHNWIVIVECEAESLDQNGMVIDFKNISGIVNQLDHQNLNEFMVQPTAEFMARWICQKIPFCVRVTVQESEGSIVTYEQ